MQNYFDIIKNDAIQVILKDRSKFTNLYETIEKYCRNNKDIIISNIKFILGEQEKHIDWMYEIYCEDPFNHARLLSNKILNSVGKWIKLTTKMTHREFEIEYDFRKIITIYSLEMASGKTHISLNELISPLLIQNIYYMPPELEIIDIYKKLYVPNYAEEWTELLPIEKQLFDDIKKRNPEYTEEIVDPERRKKNKIEALKSIIMQDYVANSNHEIVVLGHWAINLIESEDSEPESHIDKLQIISSTVDASIKAIKSLLSRHTDMEIISRAQFVHLPKDFRIRRHTLYFIKKEDSREIPFMDVFNSAEFELVPYKEIGFSTNKRVKIANPYVLLRYAMIDLWNLKFINKIGKIDNNAFTSKITSLFSLIFNIKISKWFQTAFGISYIGTNIDFNFAKKQEMLKSKHYPYYPYISENRIQII